jgi:L-fuconolactonase
MTGRVDAHHHVWQLSRGDYGWLQPSDALRPIYRDFDLAALRPQLAAADIESTVLVQAAPTVDETHFLLEVARGSGGLVRGVVGWADLDRDDAPEHLVQLSTDPLLRSIRPMLQDLPDPEWILRPRVQRSLATLADIGVRFDALVKPRELGAVRHALERHPDLAAVVDHCAKPDIASGAWQPWADDLAGIARDTRACCKLSGLVTEAGRGWSADRLRRYVDHAIECFGTQRVLWGSDWPVLTLAASYAQWSDATDVLLVALSPAEQAAIRGENARRFYGLAG